MSQEWLDQYWWLLVIGLVWEIAWKAVALWKAARLGDKAWFIILLLINAMGILSIAYIFIFSKRTKKSTGEES